MSSQEVGAEAPSHGSRTKPLVPTPIHTIHHRHTHLGHTALHSPCHKGILTIAFVRA